MARPEELPDDLARILSDPSIIINRDREIRLRDGRTLFEHIHDWQRAPSNTISADLIVKEIRKSEDRKL